MKEEINTSEDFSNYLCQYIDINISYVDYLKFDTEYNKSIEYLINNHKFYFHSEEKLENIMNKYNIIYDDLYDFDLIKKKIREFNLNFFLK